MAIKFNALYASLASHLSGHQTTSSPRLHRVKKKLIHTTWLVASLVIVFNPSLNIIVPVVLVATFLSFMIIDETGDTSDEEQ